MIDSSAGSTKAKIEILFSKTQNYTEIFESKVHQNRDREKKGSGL